MLGAVKPQEHLATAWVPQQDTEMRLYRHDGNYMFSVGRSELMTSRAHGSEEDLADLAIARLADSSAARVLVGGLGMGYTLARVLRLVGDRAQVDVVELVPEVLEWNRKWLGELNGHPLRDPRVHAFEGDVTNVIRDARASYDAILLDVDNGPRAITSEGNDWLYDREGLAAAALALRPGGALAIWSTDRQKWFMKRLRSAGFEVTEERVHARRNAGPLRTIWVATPREAS